MNALDRALRDRAEDDAVLEADRDDRALGHDDAHRNGAEQLTAVLDRAFLDHRDVDDHEQLLVLHVDTRAFLRVERRTDEFLLDLGRLRDLRQLVRGWMYHIYPATLREFVYLRDPAVDRLEKFNHIIKPPFFGGLIGKRRRELDCSPYFQGPYSQRSLSFLSQVYRNSAISHFTEI